MGDRALGEGGDRSRLESREAAATRTPADSNVTTGSDPTESAVPVDTDTADADNSKQSHEAKLHDKHASTRENVDAIPTAGGEKLGQKHWGESKIVPENPKPEAGVASTDVSGMFSFNESLCKCSDADTSTDTVRDNTNRNTGSATHPGSEKEGIVDKLKDKLHLGGH